VPFLGREDQSCFAAEKNSETMQHELERRRKRFGKMQKQSPDSMNAFGFGRDAYSLVFLSVDVCFSFQQQLHDIDAVPNCGFHQRSVVAEQKWKEKGQIEHEFGQSNCKSTPNN
jgi:hypothetical protein